MTETRTLTVELPATLAERFEAATDRNGVDTATQVTDLVRHHVDLAEAIETYVGAETGVTDEPADAGLARLTEVQAPIATLLGFELTRAGDGRAEVRFSAGPRHANPMGTLHGGVLCDVGDAAMGVAFASTLAAEESFTTLDLDVAFLKPVWEADLVARAAVTKRGQDTGLVGCDVHDAEGSLVASLHSRCLVLRGEAARGR